MTNNFDISMIIVSLNAENFIVDAIKSLLSQGLDKDSFEIIIVDGHSSDQTVELSKSFLDKNDVNYHILNNKKKILSAGWNLGLKSSKGDYVIRIDAHSEIQPGYIMSGVTKLKNQSKLAGVGGVIQTTSNSFIGDRISTVLSSKIAVGSSLFRVGVTKDTITDTAVYAVYKREVFEMYGFFDESLKRNQDIDFHKRLTSSGLILITSPDMRAKYHSRSSVLKFVKQAFSNGFWVVNSKGFYLRHLAPLGFTSILFFLLLLNKGGFIVFILIYLAVVFLFLLKVKIVNSMIETLLTFLLHIFYGIGSIYGLIKKLSRKIL